VQSKVDSVGGCMKPFSSNMRKKVTESGSDQKCPTKSFVQTPLKQGLIRDCSEADLLVDALCEDHAKSVEASILAHIPLQRERVLELLAD
jgi:hypothetical protein